MTPQEIQIAVAEEMGWTYILTGKFPEVDIVGVNPRGTSGLHTPIPPYTTSIDAIQKACLERLKTGDERSRFANKLGRIAGLEKWIWQLTALDWCEAFLATCKEIKPK